MQSQDLSYLKFAQLQALFPQVFTEAKDEGGNTIRAINTELLEQEINTKVLDGKKERYEFTWPDKRKAIRMANTPTNAALRPCREESVDFDTTENLYIEGDNLEVLKLLRETYLNKVKMIYIDPPYNTGKDFVYHDNFTESVGSFLERDGQYDEQGKRLVTNLESNGRFHTDWLNMMYPRLKIARDLLTDDGVIFISIDDSEVHNLRKICDEVFGEINLAATFLWTKTSTPPSLSNKTRKTVEYVLAFEKKISPNKYFGDYLDNGDAPLLNSGNPMRLLEFPAKSIKFSYIIEGLIPDGPKDKLILHDLVLVSEGINQNPIKMTGEFKWTQETLNEEIRKGTYFIVKTDKFSIRFQREFSKTDFKTPTNFLDVELNMTNSVNTNESAVKELNGLQMPQYFDYPKPTTLLKKLIDMVCKFDNQALILDFFSGSSTTAHAVMQLNAEDGGKRKFIMVQLPEETPENSPARSAGFETISDIGKERIRRAGRKIKEESPITTTDLDVGFRVLKLASSNMKEVFYTPDETLQTDLSFDGLVNNIKEDRSDEDLLFQVMLELGIPLSSKIEKRDGVFYVEETYLIACFQAVDNEQIKEIAQKEPYYVVFRDSSFANDSDSINFGQIFATYSPHTKRRVL
jgi:adenine-specific DNA-methyltransferase